MSPFGIFTIVLISLYTVYYAVLITRDVYSKKSAAKPDEEEFDISSLQDENAAVGVEESESGFSLTPLNRNGETKPSPFMMSGGPDITPIDNGKDVSENDESDLNKGVSATQVKIDKVQEEMDEIDPIGNLTMSKEFFRDLLLQANQEGSLFVQKKHVPAV